MSLILDGSVGVSDVDGSAATPAYRGADANTGMFFPAADTIAFSEGGVESMRITSAGNVLINTSTARTEFNSRLLIEGTTSNATGSIAVINNNASAASGYIALGKTRGAIGSNTTVVSGDNLGSLAFYGADGTGLIYSAGITATSEGTIATGQIPSRMSFSTANSAGTVTERMRIDSSGNVGIGTSSPLAPLQVTSSTATNTIFNYSEDGASFGPLVAIRRSSASPAANDGLGYITFQGQNSVGAFTNYAGIYSRISDPTNASEDGTLLFYTTTAGSATEKVRIDSSGNVGIGTNSPATLLSLAANNTGAENNTLRFWDTATNTTTNQQIGKIEFYSSDTSSPGAGVKSYIGAFSTDGTPEAYLAFATADGAAQATERMRIDSSGNVGIGTTNPGYKLDVYDATSAVSALRGDSNVQSIVSRASTDTSGAQLQIWKSRGTQASPTIVASGDIVGRLQYFAYDGSTMLGAAEIRATIDGTPGTNDMPGRLAFFTTADGASTVSERMRITSAGDLLVGVTGTGVPAVGYAFNSSGFLSIGRASGATQSMVLFYNGSTLVGEIRTSTTATSYLTSSDYRLKENIAPMTGALNKVAQLKPVTYTWKSNGESAQGFIAHELGEVCPDAVSGAKDEVDEDGNPKYQGIDTSFLVATLTAAIQELKAELDTVKAELATLKA